MASKEVQTQSLKTEVEHLKRVQDKLDQSLKHMCEELSSEKGKVSSLISQLEEKDNILLQLKEDLKLEHQHIISQLQSELSVLKQENSSLIRHKRSLEGELSGKKAELREAMNEYIIKEEGLRREIESSLNKTISENTKLHEKVSDLMSTLSQTKTNLANITDKFAYADEMHKHEIEIIKKENDAYTNKCSILDKSLNELKKLYDESNEKIETLCQEIAIQKRHIEVSEEKHSDDQAENFILKSKLEKMNKDRHEADNQSMDERERLRAEISNLKVTVDTERKKMEDILHEKEKSFKNQISKEKRKAECYKEKAIEAHTKKLQIKQLLLNQEGQQSF